ncbi:MAG: hypothetical protein ABIQ04_04655 [Candidatus Saccharimonadales bacterium]
MVKHKNTFSAQNKVTINFGYALFALTVLSFLLSTAIPFGSILFVPTAKHFNIFIIIIAFAVAAIFPALISYLIGDRATHAKNKLIHHYNGVLFGVAAFWIAQLFAVSGLYEGLSMSGLPVPISLLVSNIVPVVLTILLITGIAVSYAKSNKNTSVLLHRPYQVLLIATVIGLLFYLVLNQKYETGLSTLLGIASIAVPILLVGISYKVLSSYKTSQLTRLTDAIVAMSMGWITIYLAYSLTSLIQLSYELTSLFSYAAGLTVLSMYLYLRRRNF